MHQFLEGHLFSTQKKPSKLIVMLHGYGDNAENFINIAALLDKEVFKAQYIALNAPRNIESYPMGYQWFDLYPNGVHIREAKNKDLIIVKKNINESVAILEKTIKYHLKLLNLNLSDCIIIGFSQGGMIAFALGNYLKEKLRGLVILSGRILEKNKITNPIVQSIPIFISHGDMDDILPVSDYKDSVNFLKNNKCNFESHLIVGDTHTISPKTINLLQKFIEKIL